MKKRTLAAILAVCAVVICAVGLSTCRGKPESIDDVLAAAQQYILDGNYEEAIAAFNKVIEIDPRNPDAYNGLYTVYVENKDYANAWETIRQGIEANGGDPDNSTEPDTDSPDPLQGLDLLIHDLKVLERIMSHPTRFVTTEGNNTYTTDYEYEFDDNGYVTLERTINETGVHETRYTNNSVGIPETMDSLGINDYKLTKTDTNYIATYNVESLDGNRLTEEIYDLDGRILQFNTPDSTATYTYDENGELLTREAEVPTGTIHTYYGKNYPVREEFPSMFSVSDDRLFDSEDFTNRFDKYGRIEQVDVTCHNSETSESFYWQTRNYYYTDQPSG